MLMVVAMASFLFVGCLGTTPPIEPDEPDEPVLPSSVTPVIEKITKVDGVTEIINLYSSTTQYMNKGEVTDGILVKGFAPKYSEVKVYIDGGVAGTGYSYGVLEEFTVFVTKDNLGLDGVKTLYATATEVALAESDPSTEYAFTLDTVAPEIVKVTAEVEEFDVAIIEGTQTVTFSEELDEDTIVLASINLWDIKDITTDLYNHMVNESVGLELISPEVIELTIDIDAVGDSPPDNPVIDPPVSEGDLIRVKYEIRTDDNDFPGADGWVYIRDLAGNLLSESVHYCYLEVAE